MNLGVLESRQSLSGGSLIVNTAIGNMADEIMDKTALAALLAIPEDTILFFTKKWNNVYAYIGHSYDLPDNAFKNKKVSFYRDEDGRCTSLGINAFLKELNDPNYNNLREVYFPSVLEVGDFCFRRSYAIERIYLPECVKYGGGNNITNGVFDFVSTPVVYAHTFMQTINSGSIEPDLQEAQSNGCDVRYITDTSTPSKILDLAVTETNSIAFKPEFTVPDSINPVEFYNVYLNGLYFDSITAPGAYVGGFVPLTDLSVLVQACDSFYNSSILSNAVSINTLPTSYPLEGLEAYITTAINKVFDLKGRRKLTNIGAVTVPGKIGEALSFDGVNDYVTSSYFPPTGNAARSFAIWFKTTSPNEKHLIEYGTGGTNYKRFTLKIVNGKPRFEIQGFGKTGTTTVSDGNWHLLIYTHDGSSTVAGSKVYLDNVLEIDCSADSASLDTGTLKPLGIARDVVLALNRYFLGTLLPIPIWNRALTTDEMTSIWDKGNGLTL